MNARMETMSPETLGQEHVILLQNLQTLEEVAHPKAWRGSPTELSACLKSTLSRVAEHFRFEEECGYLDEVRSREPRLERTIQHLSNEHHRLVESLEGLIENVVRMNGSVATDDRPLRSVLENVRAWVAEVREHEHQENSVVQDAFNQDIGAED